MTDCKIFIRQASPSWRSVKIRYIFPVKHTVLNANLGTASLEVSADSCATWKSTSRNTNNFFEPSGAGGTGTTTARVRVTSSTGTQVVVKDVDMTANTITKVTANYE